MYCSDAARIKSVLVNDSTGSPVTVVSGVSTQTINVMALDLTLSSPTTLDIRSNTTSLSGPQTLASKVLDFRRLTNNQMASWYDCNKGEDLRLDAGSAVQVTGTIWYVQE